MVQVLPLSAATTVTVVDPEATEVVSFTASVTDASDNNVDTIAAQIVDAINNNTETPIDFRAEYDAATTTIMLAAERAGNTNPWTIVFDNNGVTGVNAGNLSTITVQTGRIINQIDLISVVGDADIDTVNTDTLSVDGDANLNTIIGNGAALNIIADNDSDFGILNTKAGTTTIESSTITNISTTPSSSAMAAFIEATLFNLNFVDKDFFIRKMGSGNAYHFNAGDDITTIDSDTINFVANTITGLPSGGADGLSITDTVNLNLLEGTTVLSTVVLPSSSGTTVIAGTANEIINTVSGDTNTLSLATAITGAITANTAKTGITTAQASAITANTSKVGITTAQATAITNNTAKVGITTAQATAITDNTSKTGITTAQSSAITANTAKTGISTAQASAITANTAKNSYPTADFN